MKIKLPPASSGEIKMTPMIDVIFLLLIFFICTADFKAPEKRLPAELPPQGASAAAVVLPEPMDLDSVRIQMRIQMAFDPQSVPQTVPQPALPMAWTVEGNVCSSLDEVREILQKIAAMKPDIPVMIESEDRIPMENVIDLYDLCRRTGFVNIQFSAD